MQLDDNSKVAVMGGGPAGAFFAYFLLELAERVGMELNVDVYDPKDFMKNAPSGCNMCGGIISESLVQSLATEGINLPPPIVQRGIEAYELHMDVGDVRIEAPNLEQRIGAVFRGAGPRGDEKTKTGFDGHLQKLAEGRGAKWISERITQVSRNEDEAGKIIVQTKNDNSGIYDLLVVACGLNTSGLKIFETMDLPYKAPASTKTFIREYRLGEDVIEQTLGNAMHVFLLDIPHVEFAALIPKGDYVTFCMLGSSINQEIVKTFLDAPEVRPCFPKGFPIDKGDCQCMPRLSTRGAKTPYADRIVFIGDAGVTRLYKDGIGAAYKIAKAAATTAIFHGISRNDFHTHFRPACRKLLIDNALGRLVFFVTGQIQSYRFARAAMRRAVIREQKLGKGPRWMSSVLWDTFTGSAPYLEIFIRALRPSVWMRLISYCAAALI
ncbi:hypothetical protein BVY01_00625, partial [bacterium I07]